MIRRINLFGGPCSAKSSTAAWLFAELKVANFNIQLIDEYCKKQAYEGKAISCFDEVYFLAKQIHQEDSYLRNGAQLVISDSPVLMIGAYATRNKEDFAEDLINLAVKFEKMYPSINIFLDRTGIPYKKEGRYENLEEAVRTDQFILETLRIHLKAFTVFSPRDRGQIFNHIVRKILSSGGV